MIQKDAFSFFKCAAVVIFLSVAGCSSSQKYTKVMDNAFKMADTDRSNTLSRNEFKTVFSTRFSQLDPSDSGQIPAKRLCPTIFEQKVCDQADTNKDGIITINELYDRADREFDRVDANKDGQLTKREYFDSVKP